MRSITVLLSLVFIVIFFNSVYASSSNLQSLPLCQSCHGDKLQGNESLKAPLISGLSQWYLYRQMKNYKDGIRCNHPQDIFGQSMRLSIMSLSDNELQALAEHISTISVDKQPQSIKGDIETGKFVFEHCISCHGEFGEGDQTIGAPRLTGQSDWYLYQQMINFQKDIRGNHQDDLYGKLMKDMAYMFNEQMLKDVVSYISTIDQVDNKESVK